MSQKRKDHPSSAPVLAPDDQRVLGPEAVQFLSRDWTHFERVQDQFVAGSVMGLQLCLLIKEREHANTTAAIEELQTQLRNATAADRATIVSSQLWGKLLVHRCEQLALGSYRKVLKGVQRMCKGLTAAQVACAPLAPAARPQ